MRVSSRNDSGNNSRSQSSSILVASVSRTCRSFSLLSISRTSEATSKRALCTALSRARTPRRPCTSAQRKRARIQPHRDLIGKARQDATLNRSRLDLSGLHFKAFIPSDREKLFGQLCGLTRGTGVYPKTSRNAGNQSGCSPRNEMRASK